MNPELQRRLLVLGLLAVGAAGIASIVAGAIGVSPGVKPARSAAPSPGVPARHEALCPLPSKLRPAFEAAVRDTKLPASLLYAVAKVESNLKPDATSAAGARGLLQLMPTTGEMLALDIDTPTSNVLAGARYLSQMLRQFGRTDVALAAYNAGPTAVTKAGGAPTVAVLSYVDNVTAIWHSHAGCR